MNAKCDVLIRRLIFLLLFLALGMVGFGRISPAQATPRAAFIVDIESDSTDLNPGDGTCAYSSNIFIKRCSLRAAIEEANALPGHDTITFAAGIDSTLTLGSLNIVDDLTIIGNPETGSSEMTRIVQMTTGSGIFYIDITPTVHFENVHMRRPVNNMWWQQPACVFNNGTLSLQGVQIQFCQGTSGAIHSETGSLNSSASLSLSFTEIFDNLGVEGGAIKSLNADLTINDSYIHDNFADASNGGIASGGNIYFRVSGEGSGALTIDHSQIVSGTIESAGSLEGRGGGIYLVDNNLNSGTHVIRGSSINNSRAAEGGAIYSSTSNLLIQETTVDNNLALDGAGLYLAHGTNTIERSTVSNGIATRGGAIFMQSNDAREESAETTRGSSKEIILTNSTLSWNEATQGSAIYLDGIARLQHVTVTKSWASTPTPDNGGAIYINPFNFPRGFDSQLFVENSVIAKQRRGRDCYGVDANSAAGTTVNNDSDGSCPGFTSTTAELLLPLADNMGPTLTHAFADVALHPYVDKGTASACAAVGAVDQRGFGRPGGTACDLGAFEENGVPTAVALRDAVASPRKPVFLVFFVLISLTIGNALLRRGVSQG